MTSRSCTSIDTSFDQNGDFESPTNKDSKHCPPVGVVVIRDTPPSSRALQEAATNPFGELPAFRSTASTVAKPSAFRLQPRGRPIATPSPSKPSMRGRKRSARCLVPSVLTVSGRTCLFEAETSRSHISPTSPKVMPKPVQKATDVISEDEEVYPNHFEAALQSLSIKSPKVAKHIDSPRSSASNSKASPRHGSSFPTSSPGSSIGSAFVRSNRAKNNESEATAKMPCGSPSSIISAPKLAPLTVLQSSNGRGEPSCTPTRRPPLHGGPVSLLLSLDSHRGVTVDGEDALETPRRPPTTVNYSPGQLSNGSSITRETPSRTPLKTPSGTIPEFVSETPSAIHSPLTPASRRSYERSPRTPLPRFKLKRKHTPRSGSSHGSFQLHSGSDRDNDSLSSELTFDSPRRMPTVRRVTHSTEGIPSYTPLSDMDYDKSAQKASSAQRQQASYLPVPEWCDTRHTDIPSRNFSVPSSNWASHLGGRIMPSPSNGSAAMGGKMFPEVPRLESRLQAMTEEDNFDQDSDFDVGGAFVLTDPATLLEESQSIGISRQRQRLSYTSLNQSSARQSSTSLASSAHASSTSLLGMDFIRGDSTASLVQSDNAAPAGSGRVERPGNGPSSKPSTTQRFCLALAQNIPRLRSDTSLASIGLALEPTSENKVEKERNVFTPPVMERVTTSSPPPLPSAHGMIETTPLSSMFYARSSVDFQAHQESSPRVECHS